MVNFAIISIASSRENDFKFWAHSSYVSDLQDKYISKSWVIWKLKGFSCITGNVSPSKNSFFGFKNSEILLLEAM